MLRYGLYTTYKGKEYPTSLGRETCRITTKDVKDKKLGFELYDTKDLAGNIGEKRIGKDEMRNTVQIETYGIYQGVEFKLIQIKEETINIFSQECLTEDDRLTYKKMGLTEYNGIYYVGEVDREEISDVYEVEVPFDVNKDMFVESDQAKKYYTYKILRYAEDIQKASGFLLIRGFELLEVREYIIEYIKGEYRVLVYYGRQGDRAEVDLHYWGKDHKRDSMSIGWIMAVERYLAGEKRPSSRKEGESKIAALHRHLEYLEKHFDQVMDISYWEMCHKVIKDNFESGVWGKKPGRVK